MKRLFYRFIDSYIFLFLILVIKMGKFLFYGIKKKKINAEYKKILIVKLAALGDTVMMIPIIRALRKSIPSAYICALVSDINKGAIFYCPYLNQIKTFDLNNPLKALRTIIGLRRERFDVVIDFEQRIKLSALISYFSGGRETRGFQTRGYGRHYLYTKVIPHRSKWHEFDCMVDLVRDITGEIIDRHLECWITNEDKKWAEDFIRQNNLLGKKIIVLHPGCGERYIRGARAREWPKENFVALGDELTKEDNTSILISGGKSEISLAEEIAVRMKQRPLVLAGFLTVGQLSALLKHCVLLICSDTGIMHLAAACNIKTIALFGPSDPLRWKPFSNSCSVIKSNASCSPCQIFGIDKPHCKKFSCMRNITVEKVLQRIKTYEKI